MIDVAGAAMGGAASYLNTMNEYLLRSGRSDEVRVIGVGRPLGLRWLMTRERLRVGSSRSIAANNVSFVAGDHKVVVLRNALHFLTGQERSQLGRLGPRVSATARLVRAQMRRADTIVVPSRAMGERVAQRDPGVQSRITVMNHPVEPPTGHRRLRGDTLHLLCPVLDAPYKSLAVRLEQLVTEVAGRDDVHLRITTSSDWAPPARNVVALGRLDSCELRSELDSADGIVFPLSVESFGYPLAEGRLRRIPVLAPAGNLSTEIAGDSHVACDFDDIDSIRAALRAARHLRLPSLDHNPFDPDRYFDALLWGSLEFR